jgi:flagella basal body P-ring formation protein FlgA
MSPGARLTRGVVRALVLVLPLPTAMVSGRSLQAQAQGTGGAAVAFGGAAPRVTGRAPMVEAMVATRRLPRGTVLRATDLAPARVPARVDAHGRAHADSCLVAPGWVARRVIQPGEVLRPPAVAPAALVAAGQAVRYTFRHDGLELTLDGVAPVGGALGDTIPVRLGARRRVTGVVAGPAHVVATDSPRTP